MRYFLFISAACFSGRCLAQHTGGSPDTFTIDYFCYSTDTCNKLLVLSPGRKVVYSCYNGGSTKSVDVSGYTKEIAEIESIMTLNFMKQAEQCEYSLPQRDVACGYWFKASDGGKSYRFVLDNAALKKKLCSRRKLARLAKLAKRLYRLSSN